MPVRHQAIIGTNTVLLLIGPLGTKFSDDLIKIHFPWRKCNRKCTWLCPLKNISHIVQASWPSDTYVRQWIRPSLVQIMACLAPSHYLNQCWLSTILTLGNIFQWNLNQNTAIFFQENAFENVVCEMAAILSLSQYVKWLGCTNGVPK